MTASAQGYDAPAAEDLMLVADEVWRALLGDEEILVPVPNEAPTAWSGAVSVTGGWQGNVTVELGASAAADLAACMLGLPAGEPATEEDVADAVGELVNMVGGNVKSMMEGPSVLSLPLVAAGRAAHRSEVVEVARIDATWRDQPVSFAVAVPRA